MKNFKAVGLALVSVGLLFGSAARAGGESQKIQKAVEKKMDYLDRVTRFERDQIQLGQLALQHSQQPRVREFANRLINDHKASLKTIQTWAEGRAMQVAAMDEDANQGTGGSGTNSGAAMGTIAQTSAKGAQANNEYSKKSEQLRQSLGALPPEKFDKEFLSSVIKSQEEGKKMLKQGGNEFEADHTLAAVLAKGQPTIDAHIAQAKSLKDML